MANADNKTNNRLTILAMLGVFTLPVIIAWSAYFNGWFQKVGNINKGELIQPVIDFTQLQPQQAGEPIPFLSGAPWRIVLPISDAACLDSEGPDGCLLSIFIMGQVHQALGKEQERVKRLVYIGDMNIEEEKLAALKERFVELEFASGKSITGTQLTDKFIYIADPIGNIMLRYPVISDQEGAFLKGKEILQDLKKLLKISRIG